MEGVGEWDKRRQEREGMRCGRSEGEVDSQDSREKQKLNTSISSKNIAGGETVKLV